MFITQVIIPVLLVGAVCFWAGMRWQKERRAVELRKPVVNEIRKRYDRRV